MTIKELRASTGMSQRKFAEYFGISVRNIQEWEQERKQPPPYLAGLLKRILENELPDITGKDENSTSGIKNATAIYTGGNIYIYHGKLENGRYFRACDDWDFIEICNSDTGVDEADYSAFYDLHRVTTLTGQAYEELWNEILTWIIHNRPSGNYQASELESRFKK